MDDKQIDYWNHAGAKKTFSHPVNLNWLQEHLKVGARILEYGCGYGRIAALLHERGYRVVGVDPAEAMIEKARKLCPAVRFEQIAPSSNSPFDDGSFDAALLFGVLTCIPADEEQRAVVEELHRVVRPGGLLYVSDYWLQSDQRNCDRYAQYEGKHRTYGVFETSEGIVFRHHDREWITSLLCGWEQITTCDFQVMTMDGHDAAAFQWLGRKRQKYLEE